MKFVFLLILFPVGILSAETYVYRVNVEEVQSAKASASTVGVKSSPQPYMNVSVMIQPDTNYVLLSVTTLDGQDPKLNFDVYKVIVLDEDGFFYDKVDNSKLYPTDVNWSIERSSKSK